MLNLKQVVMASAIALALSAGTAFASTATFTGASGYPTSYSEAGMTFTSLYSGGGGHVHLGDYPYTDTIRNHDGGCCTTPIEITQTGGGAFTLSSLDIIFDSGVTTFVGSNAAVYTVSGTGYVSFGTLFAGVTSVMWNAADTSSFGDSVIDNVEINSAVPEPETYAMLLAGLGMLGFAARRRKQKLATA